jgi:AcrR family transcriptional regulator
LDDPIIPGDDPPTAAGRDGAVTRSAIIDATIAIMREDGYASVGSRRIAAEAGLKSKLVHYYFKTMDELFLAVYKRIEDEHFARLTRALASRKPLRALWRLNMDATNTSMVLELTALANHRKGLRAEIARASERFRLLQAAMFERAVREAGGAAPLPPMVVSVLALALSRLLAMDSVLGVSTGHAETLRAVDALLSAIEEGQPFVPPADDPGAAAGKSHVA